MTRNATLAICQALSFPSLATEGGGGTERWKRVEHTVGFGKGFIGNTHVSLQAGNAPLLLLLFKLRCLGEDVQICPRHSEKIISCRNSTWTEFYPPGRPWEWGRTALSLR